MEEKFGGEITREEKTKAEGKRGFDIRIGTKRDRNFVSINYLYGDGCCKGISGASPLDELLTGLLANIEINRDIEVTQGGYKRNNKPIEIDVYSYEKEQKLSLSAESLLKIYARSERVSIKFEYHYLKK